MRGKFFDLNGFIEVKLIRCGKSINDIQSSDISDWLDCSVRSVQKWCLKNNIEYKRINGRKNYIWNKETLEKYVEWYNEKSKEKSYYVHKEKKPKPEKTKKVRQFITIPEIIREIIPYDFKEHNSIGMKVLYKTSSKNIQRWCKENNIPLVDFGGRKYYEISKPIKLKIIKKFKNQILKNKPLYLCQYDNFLIQ